MNSKLELLFTKLRVVNNELKEVRKMNRQEHHLNKIRRYYELMIYNEVKYGN